MTARYPLPSDVAFVVFLVVFLLLLLLWSRRADAQGVPIPPQQITWVQANIDPAFAQTFVYTLTVNEEGNPTPRPVPILSVLCGGPTQAAECSTPLPVTGQSAIISGNVSRLTAMDPRTNQSSPASAPFTGNQGCIFRDALYAIARRAQLQVRKQELSSALAEFKKSKFKHISTQDLKGNAFLITEECVGYLVP
jgi:hypothetical protein